MVSSLFSGRPGRLAGHAALYGTAGVLSKAAALLAVPYISRQLGPVDYGLADLATSLSALLVLLVHAAGDISTMRLAASLGGAARRPVYTAFIGASVVVGSVAALALIPAADLISTGLWSTPGSAYLVIAALALVPVNAVQAALASLLRFAERPRAFAVVAAIDLLAQVSLAVLLVALGFGPLGVILGYVLGGAIGLIAAGVVVRGYLVLQIEAPLAWRIIREGIPFLPGVAAFVFADTISRMFAANVLGVSAVGQLALAIRIASVMGLAAGAFSAAWGPYGLALTPSPATRSLFGRVLTVQTVVIGCLTLVIGAMAPEITVLVGGEGYTEAAQAVPGLLLSAGLAVVIYVLTTAAGIAYLGRWVAWSALSGGAVQLAATAILLPPMGIGGFAVASVIGRVVTIGLLGRAVAGTAWFSGAAIAILLATAAGTLLAQVLNSDPDATLLPRMLLAASAAVVGAVWLVATMMKPGGQAADDLPAGHG